jgi:mannitol/fructose-specific phosphotransferase system IIA component (Ntr-type)
VKLQRLLEPERVFLALDAADLRSALESVATHLGDATGLSVGEVVNALIEREKLGSTSVGDGFAIPHCKLPGLKTITVALARLNQGIDFGAADGTPVAFFFVVLSPNDQPAAHLQVLSQIARVLKRRQLRAELLAAPDRGAVIRSIRTAAEAEGL